MRAVFAATAIAVAMSTAMSVAMSAAAHAETRLFVIANHADGYGVDNCLASGAACGKAVANSYCRSHDFAQALSFQKVDRGDITGAIPADATSSCGGGSCDHFVAIECSR
jgi:hypothetical protein